MTEENGPARKKTTDEIIEEDNAALDRHFERKKREAQARSPYASGLVSGDARERDYDSQLMKEEGQGIGDLYSNQQLAQLNVEAQQGQAHVVGEESTISERRRQVQEEEASFIPPLKIGPDSKGKMLGLLEYNVDTVIMGGQQRYQMTAVYGTRWWQGLNNDGGVREIDRDSMMDKILNHARRLGVYFGNGLSRNLLNPSVEGRDVSLTIYGVYRRELLKGAVTGTRAELYTLPVSGERLKGIIAALEPESISQIAKEQEEG